ncbi:hypothetical protein Tco_1520712, partial [Tanacetum coccineum]
LTVGHPNDTLAKITHIGNLRLNNNVALFDILVVLEYCVSLFLKKRVLGTRYWYEGVYMFDVDGDKFVVWYINPCDVCHKAKQTKEAFPLSDHKYTIFGELIHLDVWGSYKVASREGFRLLFLVLNGKSPFSLVDSKEPNLSYLKSFECLGFATMVKGSDKFLDHFESGTYNKILYDPMMYGITGPLGRDGRVHQLDGGAPTYHTGHDGEHSATLRGNKTIVTVMFA